MKKYNKLFAILFAGMALTSCESVLDKDDFSSMSPDYVFSDSLLATSSLNYIYNDNLPAWGGVTLLSNIGGSTYTEESFYTASTENKFIEGTITESAPSVSEFPTSNTNSNIYARIRNINSFLSDLKQYGTFPTSTMNRLEGQALFLRAWRYFELVKLYGGVPLITSPQYAVGVENREAALVGRNTTAESFNLIVADLDAAIEKLPAKWATSDYGRVTKLAAAALKGRVLLYAASPQFNPSNDVQKWTKAYDANKQAFDLCTANGVALFSDYGKLWFTESGNSEALFVTVYNTSTGDNDRKNGSWEGSCRPKYSGGSGSNLPTWDLIKAYPMKDGKAVTDPSSKYAYTDLLFYKNRDPRFEKTIAYNGCIWPMTGLTNNRLWTYKASPTNTSSYENNGANFSNTGFYCRKAVQTSDVAGTTLDISAVTYSGTDWIELRFAEVLLNLAEAAAGAGKVSEAYAPIISVRKRAGIEAGTDNLYGLKAGMTSKEMIDAVLNERQIEFAFEGKRFWDVRRHRLLESTYNGKKGTKVVVSIQAGKTAPTATDLALPIDELYTKFFTITLTPNSLMSRVTNYSDKYYFLPLPTGALSNNPKLMQNSTWGGTFDPLQ